MLQRLRRSYHASRVRGPLRRLLAAPPPRLGVPVTESRLLALDLELTGLDPSRAEVISVGFVPVDNLRIRLGEARRFLVRPNGDVQASAHVHLLRDMDLLAAGTIDVALDALLSALEGRAMLVHYAGLDHRILSRLCKERWSGPLIVPVVDTLALAHRSVLRSGREVMPGSLRLPALRARYGLPVARLHGSLCDAVATAELFLAMAAERGLQSRLSDFLT